MFIFSRNTTRTLSTWFCTPEGCTRTGVLKDSRNVSLFVHSQAYENRSPQGKSQLSLICTFANVQEPESSHTIIIMITLPIIYLRILSLSDYLCLSCSIIWKHNQYLCWFKGSTPVYSNDNIGYQFTFITNRPDWSYTPDWCTRNSSSQFRDN